MGTDICPNCGTIIQDTDAHCMECGVEIAAARRKVREKSMAERGGIAVSSEPQAVIGAAAGMADAGETSDKVRLKAFDKHLADKLTRERAAVLLTVFIALVVGAVVLVAGLGILRSAGGPEAVKALSFGEMRIKGFAMYGDEAFIAVLVLLTGVAGLLCAVGQMRRFMLAGRAIAQVKDNKRPDVVKISSWTWVGMVLASLAVPPLGLILGIIFGLGDDLDTKALGGLMVKVSGAVIGLVVLNVIWNAVGGFAGSAAPVNAVGGGPES